jgi:MSHA pilin protein MshD
VTLIELVVFIIIISVGVVGLVSVTGSLTRNSADPMIRKQAIAIAESLLLEIEQRPFTFCVPGDRNVAATSSVLDATATDPAKCWDAVESMGPETGESRYSSSAPFNNVNDYQGFSMPDATCTGICPLGSATKIDALDGYVAAASIALAGTTLGLADNTAGLKITVTVTGRGENVSLVGYRTRYAPNAGG